MMLQGIGEEYKPVGRGKRSASIRNSHEKKSAKSHDHTSSSNNIVEEDESAPSNAVIKKQVNLPTKVRSRRKIVTEKPLTIDDGKISETIVSELSDTQTLFPNDKETAVIHLSILRSLISMEFSL